MAGLHQHPKSNYWSISFRFGGKKFYKSLRTADQREANRLKGRVEQALLDLERGRFALPEGADLWRFVLSDGRLEKKPTAPKKSATLGDLLDAYFASQIGQKELNTLETERLHQRHFERVIGRDKPVKTFTAADVQAYIAARSPEVKPQTVRKEVATLRMLLYRADRLVGEKPYDVREAFRALDFAKGAEKPGFMTWAEIEAKIARTKPGDVGKKELWDRLFLDTAQVNEFLDYADKRANRQPVPFMPVLLTAAAHTGARLSELCRSQVEDWDFDRGVVVLREKKKSQKGVTFRRVDLSPRLAERMQRWLRDEHPGGQFAFCRERDRELRAKRLYIGFVNFVQGSKWEVLRGYHTLRHSFASNLARAGVDERVVDELMGHQTEEMRRRYRHFFPEQRRDAVARLFA